MKEIIALLALFSSGMGIGLVFGAVIESWHLHHEEPEPPRSCANCAHGDLYWDEEPCDGCDDDNDCWEAKDESD